MLNGESFLVSRLLEHADCPEVSQRFYLPAVLDVSKLVIDVNESEELEDLRVIETEVEAFNDFNSVFFRGGSLALRPLDRVWTQELVSDVDPIVDELVEDHHLSLH